MTPSRRNHLPAPPIAAAILVRQECSPCSVFVNWHGMICMSTGPGVTSPQPHPNHPLHIIILARKTHPDTACHAWLRISNEPTSDSEAKACRTVEYFRSPAAPELCFELSIIVYASLSAKGGCRGAGLGGNCTGRKWQSKCLTMMHFSAEIHHPS